ncbi:YdcF family protein [Corynebacterium alimapuense]|uniref:YdcF family protein n=1 Tax=Corynebacterium alimapuense TaxID=1576874 RepID=A0A3M8K6C7_9CORY|nr:YdcF family protein [Corynebacterium alimapuense]RNE48773.1 YdcF family protein [Corynebacterium alimapuense]
MTILVLGARVQDGQPSRILRGRLLKALTLSDQSRIVVSGQGEAETMCDWLVAQGVDARRILLESAATSTNENLENAKILVPDTQLWTVVTSDFHVWRTRLWAWHLAIPVEVISSRTPCGIQAWMILREGIALPHSVLRIVWRRFRERISSELDGAAKDRKVPGGQS